jgi:CheY-like chemotaxis protein
MSETIERQKVLIVEDEGMVALVIRHKLQRMGYEVCGTAASGEEAVEAALEHRPNLVIMDVHLSGRMTGFDAARRIVAEYDVPFIFFTGYEDSEVTRQIASFRRASSLTKPVEIQVLAAAVEQALANGSGD